MKKIYHLIFAWTSAMLCAGVAQAQERIMFSVASGAPEGLYYLNKNGGQEIHACNFLPAEALGSGTEYFIVSKDGELIGVNSEDGLPETEETVGFGTLYRLTAKGVIKVQDFDYAEASSTFLVEGWSDGKLYATAPRAPSGAQIMEGTKYNGLTGTVIRKYGFRPGELLAASNGSIYGTAPVGGANNQGYIYTFTGTDITIVYSFSQATGRFPQGRLMQGQDGYLYGVGKRGGTLDYGVIYKVRTDGTGYQVLYNFDKVTGMHPDRGLVQDAAGNLYGMTFSGGANNLGVVYKIRPDGTGFTKLHDFAVKQQYHSGVLQSLLLDSNGFLYGRVPQSQSMIFRIKTDGTSFKILYSKIVYLSTIQLVSSITPQYKLADPLHGATGVATTRTFVADSVPGAVSYTLELSTTSDFSTTFAVVHSTHHRPLVSGLSPSTKYYARVRTSLWDRRGPVTSFTTGAATTTATSVVTTPANGSVNASAPTLKVTVKAVTGAKRYTVQLNNHADFAGTMLTQTSAVDNQRTLTFTGLQYNTKYYARVKTDNNEAFGPITSFTTKSEVFSYLISPAQGATEVDRTFVQASLRPITGAKRYTLQVSTSATFTSNTRIVTSIDDNQTTFLLCDLQPSTKYYTRVKTDISTRFGPVRTFTTRAAIRAMRLVGFNIFGGAHGEGTIFSFSLDSMKFTKHHDTDRRISYTDVVHGPDGFYGARHDGSGSGDIFKYSFRDGFQSSAGLALGHEVDLMMASNGMLYATPDYAPYGAGAIHKLKPALDAYTRVHFFRPQTGIRSRAPLLEYGDGYLYGTTIAGGQYNRGVIFRMRGNGKNYEVLFHFNGHGYYPAGGLTDGHDGYLYGTTNGGLGNYGTVYKVKPDGSALTYLHTFMFYDGAYPTGELLIEDGVIYGVAGTGGSQDNGVLYKIGTNGTGFRILTHFADEQDANPTTGVVSDGNGYLYGCLPFGGSQTFGSIYRIKTDGSGYQMLYDMTSETNQSIASGIYPFGKPVLIEDPFATGSETSPLARQSPVDVYPNPSTHVFNLKVAKGDGEFAVELIDFAGNVVYRNNVTAEALTIGEDLPKGMYILRMRNRETTTDQMLIKK